MAEKKRKHLYRYRAVCERDVRQSCEVTFTSNEKKKEDAEYDAMDEADRMGDWDYSSHDSSGINCTELELLEDLGPEPTKEELAEREAWKANPKLPGMEVQSG